MATRDSVARHWQENFDAIEPHVGSVVDPQRAGAVEGRDERDGRDGTRGYRAAAVNAPAMS